jgi:hypothetical protein
MMNSLGYYELRFSSNVGLMGYHKHTNNILVSEQHGLKRGRVGDFFFCCGANETEVCVLYMG